jgi:hypothetical protein
LGLSLGGAIGVKAVRPITPYDRVRNLHEKFLADNPDSKIRASFERNEAATFPLSQYRDLDKAIRHKDKEEILKAIDKLRQVADDEDILKRMTPTIGKDLNLAPKPLFHESARTEQEFLHSLTDKQREEYDKAIDERLDDWHLFLDIWPQRGDKPEKPDRP